jgi:hypothetical protein
VAYQLVSTTELTTSTATISFTSIPQTGKDLLVVLNLRTDRANVVDSPKMILNSDTGANYKIQQLLGNGSTTTGGTGAAETSILGDFAAGNSSVSGAFSSHRFYVCNYSNTSYSKNVLVESIHENNVATAYQAIYHGSYTPTSAITSLSFSAISTFRQYSSASLYIIS